MPKAAIFHRSSLKVIGIDPGQSGGIAVLFRDTGKVYALEKMPPTERDIFDLFVSFEDVCIAMIEHVHSFPGQGVASSFKFGMGYGGLRMAVIAAGIPMDTVAPLTWQKFLGIPIRDKKKKETQTQHKNKLLAKAQQLFPGHKITKATADALLIAEYCRRHNWSKGNND